MLFTAKTESLSHVLALIARVSSKSPTLSGAGVLLELSGTTLRLSGYDMSLLAVVELEVDAKTDGVALVPAAVLSQIVSALRAPEVSIDTSSEPGKLKLVSTGSSSTLLTMSPSEFPLTPTPTPAGVTISSDILATAISRVRYAVATDPSRGAICALCLDVKSGSATLVATDSLRMATCSIDALKGLGAGTYLISPRALDELSRQLGTEDVSIGLNEQFVSFYLPGITFTSHLQAGQYPSWGPIMEMPRPSSFNANASDLTGLLRQVDPLAKNSTHVELALTSSELTVSTQSDQGSIKAAMPADHTGDPATFRLNPKYLRDCLAAISPERVTCHFSDDLARPLEFTGAPGDLSRHLLMPIRVV